MTDQELKKLNRGELTQLVRDQEKTIEQLQQRITNMERQQREKAFNLRKFGSIAESSLQLSGVFEAAQQAANQYLESAAQMHKACEFRKEEADRLLAETQRKCRELEEQTQAKCAAMTAKAQEEAGRYWQNLEADLYQRLEDYVPAWHKVEEEKAQEPPEEAAPETEADPYGDDEDDEDEEDEEDEI